MMELKSIKMVNDINTKNIDVFLIGCSEYNDSKQNLLFVNNDIKKLKNSFVDSLKISIENILSYNNIVNFEDYNNVINKICTNNIYNKMLIFYFSGHGCIKNKKGSCIILSDGKIIPINDLLKKINESNYKCKWVIIDACYSGQFIINENDLLVGEGTIVTCSSSKNQQSFPNDKVTMSYFTDILCNVLNLGSLKNKKNKSLAEIINLIRIIYKNDNSNQTLINRQNFLGTIYFGDKENIQKKDDKIIKYEYKDENFYIKDYEAVHSLSVKKYCIYIISKLTNEKDLYFVAKKIIKFSNQIEYYKNDKQKNILESKPVDLLWIYIYPNEYNYNIKNARYIIEYSINKGIKIDEQEYFDFILENRINNTINDEELLKQINYLYNESLDQLENLYKIIQEIKNGTWNENSSHNIYLNSKEKINKIYDRFINLPFGSNDSEYKYELILDYFNNIQDLLLFMGREGQTKWNNKDTRYSLINDTIDRINKLLNYFKKDY